MNISFIIFIGIITAILLLVHWVVYSAFISAFSVVNHKWLIAWRIIFLLLALSFVISSIISFGKTGTLANISYKLSSIWLGCLLYLFLASIIFSITQSLFRLFGWQINGYVWGGTLFSIAILISIYGVFHAQNLKIKEVNVSLSDLPTKWQGKKVIWISDIHLGRIYGKDYLEKIVNLINEERADIVFIGGDLYDGVKIDERSNIEPLTKLRSPLGTYFITGNHEEFSDSTRFTQALDSIGVRYLGNKMLEIDGVQIIGVDDRDSKSRETFERILSNLKIDQNKPTILLKHQPSELDIAAKYGVDLQISGHTHKAQMVPLNFIAKLAYKEYEYGLNEYGPMKVLTSSGAGTWGPPMRVGSDSEIVVLELQ